MKNLPFVEMSTAVAVSYTHLDVYKRQEKGRVASNLLYLTAVNIKVWQLHANELTYSNYNYTIFQVTVIYRLLLNRFV